jgi:hypothetical protein
MLPVTTPTVVTESGRIVTRTVVFTPTAAATENGNSENKSNVGAIAGGVAGGVVALLAIVGGILFVLWRKRRQQDQQNDGHENGSGGISRNVSTMSRSGLLGGRGEKSPTQLVTNFGSQRSRHDDESITPITPTARRLSQPILVDSPRRKPKSGKPSKYRRQPRLWTTTERAKPRPTLGPKVRATICGLNHGCDYITSRRPTHVPKSTPRITKSWMSSPHYD